MPKSSIRTHRSCIARLGADPAVGHNNDETLPAPAPVEPEYQPSTLIGQPVEVAT